MTEVCAALYSGCSALFSQTSACARQTARLAPPSIGTQPLWAPRPMPHYRGAPGSRPRGHPFPRQSGPPSAGRRASRTLFRVPPDRCCMRCLPLQLKNLARPDWPPPCQPTDPSPPRGCHSSDLGHPTSRITVPLDPGRGRATRQDVHLRIRMAIGGIPAQTRIILDSVPSKVRAIREKSEAESVYPRREESDASPYMGQSN